MSSAELEWEAGVDIFRGLAEAGFGLDVAQMEGRVKVASFSSSKLVLEYSVDLLTGDIGRQWRDLATGHGITDPLYAICYFSLSPNDLEGEIIDDLDRLRVIVSLYLDNKWALQTSQWAQDRGFIRALDAANDWAWREFRPLAPWEFEKFLMAKRE